MTNSNQGWIKSTCAYCGVGCGIEARPTLSGKLEVRGDKQHPSNYGKLCTKGIALGETVSTLGRLTQPKVKTKGDAGNDAVWETTTWGEATNTVAERFKKTIEEYGPDSVAFYVSGQLLTEDYYVANKLMKGFIGSANIDSNSRLCMASSVVGHKRAFGTDTVPVCYEDLEQAELVVITGSNLAWCHPVLFQRLRAAKQANPELKVVVIDPRRTETCDIADLHLPIASGSDVSLFNGLLAHLSKSGSLDKHYIQSHTEGFESALESALSESLTPQILEDITGVAFDRLQDFYSMFANTEKVITIYSQGVNQSSQGCDKVNAIINCHLATGRIGKAGMGPFSVTGQPNAMGGREVGGLANTLAAHFEFGDPNATEIISEFWQTQNLASKPGLKAIDLFDAMHDGKIKAVWIMATNPIVSLPNSEKVKQALEKCPFVVVSDCIEDTETTRIADIVLPAQGWSEKSGTVTNSERRISRQRRLLASPGEAKPDWWIIKEVAQKMGWASQFDYLHEGQIFKEYCNMTALDNRKGKQRDLCLIGLTQLDDQGYSQLSPQQWPVLELQTEIASQRMFEDNLFFTETGKAQFVAVEYQAPVAKTSAKYPLILNTGRVRDHWHTMTRTGLAPALGSHTPEPYLYVHPETARNLGLVSNAHQGLIVTIESEQGTAQARLEVSNEVSVDQVFLPIHWNETTAKNSKPCNVILNHTDQFSGQPEFKHTPVNLKLTGYLSEAALVSDRLVDCSGFDYWVKQRVEGGFLYRVCSFKDSMELVIELTNALDQLVEQDGTKSLEYQGNEKGIHFGSAKINQAGMHHAFFVGRELTQSNIDWLIGSLTAEAEVDLESEFINALT